MKQAKTLYDFDREFEKLKPCPFCGGQAIIMKMGFPHWIYCKECGARVHGGVIGEEDGEAASIAAWNRRANDDND